jgi:hypothetical protein
MSEATRDLERQLQHLETMLHELERGPESRIRTQARDVVRAVLDLHASGLDRMVQCIGSFGSGPAIMNALTSDPLIAGLLLLHDIHPQNLETRVRTAVEALAPALVPEGARVAHVSVDEGIVHVRLERELGRGGPPAAALRLRVEHALVAAAPDAVGIEIDVPDPAAFVPVTDVRLRRPSETQP